MIWISFDANRKHVKPLRRDLAAPMIALTRAACGFENALDWELWANAVKTIGSATESLPYGQSGLGAG